MALPRQLSLLLLIPLLLSLALGTTAIIAQPAPDTSPEAAAGSQQERAGSDETTPPAQTGDTTASKGNDSPFDYRPSEEISEDLPVSFPVDI